MATFTRDQIDALLRSNDRAVERGIVTLFKLQTQDEQAVARTHWHNDVGFNCVNARAGTRFARWILGLDDTNRQRFAPKSLRDPGAERIFRRYADGGSVLERARTICLKHSAQLTAVANGELTVHPSV